jgi:hypothetical protein
MKVYDTVNDKDTLILIGHHNPTNGLWHADLAHPTIHMANFIEYPTTADLTAFAHAALFSPVLSTLEAALANGYLTNFPGLTPKEPPRRFTNTRLGLLPCTKATRTKLGRTNDQQRNPSPP